MNDSKRKCDEPNPIEVAVDLSEVSVSVLLNQVKLVIEHSLFKEVLCSICLSWIHGFSILVVLIPKQRN